MADQPGPLSPEQWPPELAHILADMQGAPLNIHGLMANNSELIRAWWGFRQHGVTGGSLGQRKVELLILRVAVQLHCWYEWAAHVDRALHIDIPLERIMAVLEPTPGHAWPEEDAALLQAVDELTRTHAISPPTLALMQEYYSNDQLMDLMAIHGMYLIVAAMIKTWGLEVDADILARIAPHTDEQSFLRAAADFAAASAGQA